VLALRDAAVHQQVAVLLTNGLTRAREDGTWRPALGQWWTHVPSVQVELGRSSRDASVFTARVMHSVVQPSSPNEVVEFRCGFT
jgi:hypothetical protein